MSLTFNLKVARVSPNVPISAQTHGTFDTIDISNSVIADSIRINETLKGPNSMSFAALATTFNQKTYVPRAGNQIELKRGSTILFAGYIHTVRQEWLGKFFVYKCECYDFTPWLDHILVAGILGPLDGTTKKAGELIVDLFSSNGLIAQAINRTSYYGFTATPISSGGNVDTTTGFNYPFDILDYVYPSTIIQKLAEGQGYYWKVDYNRSIHFYDFVTQQGNRIPKPPISVIYLDDSVSFGDVVLQETIQNVKNALLVKDAMFRGEELTDHQIGVGDGTTTYFGLPVIPAPIFVMSDGSIIPGLQNAIKVKVNNVEVPVKVFGVDASVDENPTSTTAYIEPRLGNTLVIRPAPANGHTIKVSYTTAVILYAIVNDLRGIEEMDSREWDANGNGIYMGQISLPDVYFDNQNVVETATQMFFWRYGKPNITGQFTTLIDTDASTGTRGTWQPGQLIYLTSNNRDDFITPTRYRDNPLNAVQVFISDVSKELLAPHNLAVSYAEPTGLEETGGFVDVTLSNLSQEVWKYTIGFSNSPFGQ